jgi:hypothetical protein
MSISQTKYVNITSGVGGASPVPYREFITRLFTTNALVPTGGAPLEFTSASAVGSYFGTSSQEYKRASFYFGWVSKNITSPRKISYARWANVDTVPRIFGASLSSVGSTLNSLKTITDGAFKLTLGAVTNEISGLDFSGAANLAAIATILQTAIRAETGTQWTSSSVLYNATSGGFDFYGGDPSVAAVISVSEPTSGTDVIEPLGWLTSVAKYPLGPIFSNGVQTETITDTLDQSAGISDNFGTFVFMSDLTEDEVVEAAQWNLAQNVTFMFLVKVSDADAAGYSAALNEIGGTGVTRETLDTAPDEYHEMEFGLTFAATDYTAANSVQNAMYQQYALTPTVTDTATSDAYDALRINYYGETQSAGRKISFYQPGFLTGAGVSTNILLMSLYANEVWLRDAATKALFNLLLALPRVSANKTGVSQVLSVLQGVVNQAIFNGTISVGGFLDNVQKQYITSLSNDPTAWTQVQSQGYWIGCVIEPYSADSQTNYRIVYTLIYKKDDVVRSIDGRHILI